MNDINSPVGGRRPDPRSGRREWVDYTPRQPTTHITPAPESTPVVPNLRWIYQISNL